MSFRYITTKALKGQNHQHRATPCDWMTEPFQTLKGRQQAIFRLTPLQGSNSRACPSHRALPDAIAKRLSVSTTCCIFFIFHSLFFFLINAHSLYSAVCPALRLFHVQRIATRNFAELSAARFKWKRLRYFIRAVGYSAPAVCRTR